MPANDLAFALNELEHGGLELSGGWDRACPLISGVHETAKQIEEAVLTAFRLSAKTHGLNQLRYDPRELKGQELPVWRV